MSGECVFCRICAGTAPAEVVHSWPDALAIRPRSGGVHPGHVLVLPRAHVRDAAAEPAVTAAVMGRAAELAAALGQDSNLIANIGEAATQTVFHLHVHLVPRAAGDGLALPWAPAA
ncbi:HIT family protein [Nocardiopsis sp. CNT-189]|uniref:HIT family protein n=1 Tax=Nocardiopsis oceanisediminis TaxID=2816862 RepID=UPI003B363687